MLKGGRDWASMWVPLTWDGLGERLGSPGFPLDMKLEEFCVAVGNGGSTG